MKTTSRKQLQVDIRVKLILGYLANACQIWVKSIKFELQPKSVSKTE